MAKGYEVNIEENVTPEEMDYFIQSFRNYNTSIIGKQEVKSLSIILEEKDKGIIGGVIATIVWGWLMIDKMWVEKSFRSKGIGTKLLALAENAAISNEIKKISVQTFDDNAKRFYEKNNYIVDGTLDNRPPGYTCYFLKKEKLSECSVNISSEYNIAVKYNSDSENIGALNQKICEEWDEVLGNIPFKEVVVFARDDKHKIIGGLTGYIGWGWLYISILWIDEKYRRTGLGGQLLKTVEGDALKFGVNKAFLGTTEFQAREFYEKKGYEIFSVREDLPPGYKNFSMKKELKGCG